MNPLGEPPCHGVRVTGVAEPQVVVQQRLELDRQVAHLRRELPLLLAQERGVRHQFLGHDHDRFGAHGAVLRPAEAQHVGVGGQVGQGAAQVSGRVREPGAVDVEAQLLRPAELPQ